MATEIAAPDGDMTRQDESMARRRLLADKGVSGAVPAQRRGAAAALDDILPAYIAAVAPPSVIANRKTKRRDDGRRPPLLDID
jgi:hypothetical protein